MSRSAKIASHAPFRTLVLLAAAISNWRFHAGRRHDAVEAHLKGLEAMLQKRSDRFQENRIPDALYPRLLGVAWSEIDTALQRMHCNGEPVRALGLFRIRHGTSLWAKLFLLFLRLPPPTAAAPVELVVRPEGQSESWLRVFDGKPVLTVQREAPAGLLAEAFGALEFQFRLRFVDHAIHYEQVGVILRLALPLLSEIPLPTWASPHVSAWETAGESEMDTRISVEVSAPLAGLLFSYEGIIKREKISREEV